MIQFKDIRMFVYFVLFSYIFYLTTPFYQTEMSPEIAPMYIEFNNLVRQNCREDQYFHPQFKIMFKALEGDIIGMCMTYPNSFVIHLDTKFWKESDQDDRRQLLYHELLHCNMSLDHVEDKHNIMYYAFNKLSKDEILKQTLKHIKSKCN